MHVPDHDVWNSDHAPLAAILHYHSNLREKRKPTMVGWKATNLESYNQQIETHLAMKLIATKEDWRQISIDQLIKAIDLAAVETPHTTKMSRQ